MAVDIWRRDVRIHFDGAPDRFDRARRLFEPERDSMTTTAFVSAWIALLAFCLLIWGVAIETLVSVL
jgi:hypothetical protein